MKFFVPIVIIVLIIIGGALFMREKKETPSVGKTLELSGNIAVTVTKTDILKTGSRLPEGFPKEIPVESINIKDSYRAYYEKVRATQYTVSYTSERTKGDLWKTYSDYMVGEQYVVSAASSKSSGQISGTKGDDSLSVIITTQNSVTLVQIVYLDR